MARFRTRVFQENGNWFFRWDNITHPTACGIVGPLATRDAAELEKRRFIEAETEKRGCFVAFQPE
jgi:hypothetical protein